MDEFNKLFYFMVIFCLTMPILLIILSSSSLGISNTTYSCLDNSTLNTTFYRTVTIGSNTTQISDVEYTSCVNGCSSGSCNAVPKIWENWIIIGVFFLAWLFLGIFILVLRKAVKWFYALVIIFIIMLMLWMVFQTPTLQYPQFLDTYQISSIQIMIILSIMILIFILLFDLARG